MTADDIVIEAFKRINIPNPGQAEKDRASNFILNGVLMDIAKRRGWLVLEEKSVLVLDAYVNRYSIPADYSKPISLTLYRGGYTASMQSATPNTIILNTAETITAILAQGSPIFILTENAKGQMAHITTYNATTKEATIYPNWAVVPVSGNYLIPNIEANIPFRLYEHISLLGTAGVPIKASVYDSELCISPIPNSNPYVLLSRYQVNTYNLAVDSLKRAKLYDDWYNALLYGVILGLTYTPDDDTRFKRAFEDYRTAIAILADEDNNRRRLGV